MSFWSHFAVLKLGFCYSKCFLVSTSVVWSSWSPTRMEWVIFPQIIQSKSLIFVQCQDLITLVKCIACLSWTLSSANYVNVGFWGWVKFPTPQSVVTLASWFWLVSWHITSHRVESQLLVLIPLCSWWFWGSCCQDWFAHFFATQTRGSTRDGTGVHDSIFNQLLTKVHKHNVDMSDHCYITGDP